MLVRGGNLLLILVRGGKSSNISRAKVMVHKDFLMHHT